MVVVDHSAQQCLVVRGQVSHNLCAVLLDEQWNHVPAFVYVRASVAKAAEASRMERLTHLGLELLVTAAERL